MGRKSGNAGIIAFAAIIMLPLFGAIMQHTGSIECAIYVREINLIRNSIKLGVGTAFLSVIFGYFCALGIHNSRIGDTLLRYYFVLFLPIPFYIYALNWMYFFRDAGEIFSALLKYSVKGLAPCLYVETMAFLPLATLFLLIGMDKVNPDKINMALIFRSDNSVASTILLREILPFILASIGAISVLSMTEFSVPSMFQYNTYALDLFSVYSRTGDALSIFIRSIPMSVLLIIPFTWFASAINRIDYRVERRDYKLFLTGGIRFTSYFSMIISAGAIVTTLAYFLIKIGSINVLIEAISMVKDELRVSFFMSLFSGLIATVFSLLFVNPISKKKLNVLNILLMYAIVVPGAIQAMGLLKIINSSIIWKLQKTLFLSSIGCALKFLPYVVIIMLIAQKRIDFKKFEMIEILSQTLLKEKTSKIYMMRKGIALSFIVVFLLSFAEESIPIVLMSPGSETITVKIYNYLHYGASEYVAAFSVVVLFFIIICEIAIAVIFKYASRREYHAEIGRSDKEI